MLNVTRNVTIVNQIGQFGALGNKTGNNVGFCHVPPVLEVNKQVVILRTYLA